MKASKLILAIMLFAFTTTVFAQSARPDPNEPPPTFTIKICLKSALQNPDLVKLMRVQLDPSFLPGVLTPQYFTAKVTHPRALYLIYVTYHEWMRFFRLNPPIDPAGTADQ